MNDAIRPSSASPVDPVRHSISTLVLLIFWVIPVAGQDVSDDDVLDMVGARPVTQASRTAAPPVIDGQLDDPVWLEATLIDQFVQTAPVEGAAPTEQTQVWAAYDDNHLYFAFHAHYADAALIRANRVDRDRIEEDDWIAVALDTFLDQQRAYRFAVNGYGVQADAIVNAGRADSEPRAPGDSTCDVLFHTGGGLVEGGWAAEMAIPFKSLRYPSRETGTPHRWGFQITRVIQSKDETIVWSPISRSVAGTMTQMGTLEGITDLSTSRNLELLPTVTAIRFGALDTSTGRFDENDTSAEAGLNIKYGVTSHLTADLTFNPDFSQIESDRAQIEVNQRFPLFFPELRPFFLEGREVFETRGMINLVHTRTIVDPRVGAKLTGKVGNTTLGVLIADDEAPGRRDDVNDPAYGQTAQFFIGRARYDLYAGSYVGAIFTDREFMDGYSRVAGLDGRFRLGQTYNLFFVASTSSNREEDEFEKSGPMFGVAFTRDSRHLDFGGSFSRTDPDFDTKVGFVRRVDVQQANANVSYEWWPERTLISWGPRFNYLRNHSHDGVLQDEDYRAGLNFRFARNVDLRTNTQRTLERFNGIDFRMTRFSAGGSVNASRRFALDSTVSWGDQVRFSADPFLGRGTTLDLNITVLPTSRLRANVSANSSRLTDPRSNREVFRIQLYRAFITYQFTDRLLLRNISEHNSLDKTLGLNFLVTYRVNAGTVLYVGYDDHHQQADLIDGDLDGDGVPDQLFDVTRLTRTNRTVFMKFQYLFRY